MCRLYACMWIYLNMYVHMCLYYVHMFIVCICMYNMYIIYVYVSLCMHIYVYVCIYACVGMFACVCMHCMYHVCVCVNVYIHMYECMYVHVFGGEGKTIPVVHSFLVHPSQPSLNMLQVNSPRGQQRKPHLLTTSNSASLLPTVQTSHEKSEALL